MTTLETVAMSKENPAEYLANLTLDLVVTMLNQIDFESAYEQLAKKYPEIVFDDEFKEAVLGDNEFDETFRNREWLEQYMRDTGMYMALEGNYQTMVDEFKQKEIEEEPETVM